LTFVFLFEIKEPVPGDPFGRDALNALHFDHLVISGRLFMPAD
jgi:hypothetical protein